MVLCSSGACGAPAEKGALRRVKAIKFICKEGDQREKEIEKLLSLQQNCQKLTFTELWLICVDEEEAPSPRRLREGVQKNRFFFRKKS